MNANYLFNGQATPVPTRNFLSTIKRTHRFFCTLLFIFFFSSFLHAQYTAGNPSMFGIDGDLYTEKRSKGTFAPAGSHDWFKINEGSGLAIFDTIDAYKIREQLAQGKNFPFAKKMQYGAYTVQSGYLMLDGTYSRDYFGNDTTLDKTIFSTSGRVASQNAMDPAAWVTNDKGSVLPSKSDIIDTYIHMRRNGTSIEPGNASPLFVFLGASTMSTLGDHHVDFELFKAPVKYGGGKFSQTSIATNTGGRDLWTFNSDGSVRTFGGMSFSISFNNQAVTDISIYIWVDYKTYATVNPAKFDFAKDSDSWNGEQPNGGFGFARIIPNNGTIGTLPAWGAVDSLPSEAPLWGTTNKEFSSQGVNYFYTKYTPGQFAEAAIDLSSMGVDPAFSSTFDKCTPPYRRVVIKTRSSSSFSSALQDFAGPFEFLDAPTVPATISTPSTLNCVNSSITLTAAHPIIGANYIWTNDLGATISQGTASSIIVSKPGKYTLTASLYEGCTPSTEKQEVFQDMYQPFATASSQGSLTTDLKSTVYLVGGNTDSSNYQTPFGGSKGLSYKWSGPDMFTATAKDTLTNKEGQYSLIVTELRNGCKDTAFVNVGRIEAIILPIKIKALLLEKSGTKHLVKWTVTENENIDRFEIEKGNDGKNYKTAAHVLTSSKKGDESYIFTEQQEQSKVYYRIKIINKEQKSFYSTTVVADPEGAVNAALNIQSNPVLEDLKFNYYSSAKSSIQMYIYCQNGTIVYSKVYNVSVGKNYIHIDDQFIRAKGSYILEVISSDEKRAVAKFVKL